MVRRIKSSWLTHWAVSRSKQCFTTGVTKAEVCVIHPTYRIYIPWICYTSCGALAGTRNRSWSYLLFLFVVFICLFVWFVCKREKERERNVLFNDALNTFYLRLYGVRHIVIVRKETRCRHIGYSYRLTARVLLYAPFPRQDNTYDGRCYTSRGALAGTRSSSMGPPHEGSIRRPIAP